MLKTIYKLEYDLKLLSGLHIGGSTDIFDIGGADSTVIKNPLTLEPYIPGSSIKGKLRSLLALKYGHLDADKKNPDLVFNNAAVQNLFEPVEENENKDSILISRAIFRDAVLTDGSREDLEKHLGKGVFTEIKAENKINPLKGTAEHPRFIERVPAGAIFHGELVLQVFDEDQEDTMKKALLEALKLLENNYLGGSGTRGYGRVQIMLDEQPFEKVMINADI